MSRSRSIPLFIIVLALLAGLCACDSEFETVRERIKENKAIKQESELQISDIEVLNVDIDFLQSSSYSNFLNVVGIVKNNSNIKANSITLTIYLYQNDSVILTEKDYIFDLGAYDENSFKFMIDKVKLLTCDKYVVKVTNVF